MTQTTPTPGAGEFPPLPEPARRSGQQMSYDGVDKVFFDCYDSTQMLAYAQAAIALRAQAAEGEQPINASWNRETGTSLNPSHTAPKRDPMDPEISALRWLLNITTEFDRKDVRTRQAARLLDDYSVDGKTNREHLESLWSKLAPSRTLPEAAEGEQSAPAVAASASDAVADENEALDTIDAILYQCDRGNVSLPWLIEALRGIKHRAALTQGVKQEGPSNG